MSALSNIVNKTFVQIFKLNESDNIDINNNDIIQPNLRHHVFMSKETTKELSEYILPEEWGYQAGLLYKYLDYIWRCQLYDEQVKLFKFYGEEKLVFHSGLQRRSDGESVYIILIKNDAYCPNKKVEQKWRVSFGASTGKKITNLSFATKSDLINIWKLDERDLPKPTIFYKDISELLFNPSYGFKIDWDERLRTCKTRIFKQIGLKNNDKSLTTKKLKELFNIETMRALKLAKNNPRIAVPQAFIETKNVNRGYHLELLIPLTLKLNGKKQYFALALRPFHKNKFYEGMSILTRKMAYANARLVSGIDSSWLLSSFVTSSTIIKNYSGYDDPNPNLKIFKSKLSEIPSTPSQPSNHDDNSLSSFSENDGNSLPKLNVFPTKSNQSTLSNDSFMFNNIKYNYTLPIPNIKSSSIEAKYNTTNPTQTNYNIPSNQYNLQFDPLQFPVPFNPLSINTNLTSPLPLNYFFSTQQQQRSLYNIPNNIINNTSSNKPSCNPSNNDNNIINPNNYTIPTIRDIKKQNNNNKQNIN